MRTEFSYRVTGTLIGRMWMPALVITQAFDKKFTRADPNSVGHFSDEITSLRNMLLSCQDWGDVRNADFLDAELEISYVKNGKRIKKFYDLSKSTENADLFCTDQEMIDEADMVPSEDDDEF